MGPLRPSLRSPSLGGCVFLISSSVLVACLRCQSPRHTLLARIAMAFPTASARAGRQEILTDMVFIHIPKTGGTSIEDALRARGDLTNTVKWQLELEECCATLSRGGGTFLNGLPAVPYHWPVGSCCTHPGPRWHLPPDVFEHAHGRSVDSFGGHTGRRQRWCVVRDPAARFASDRAWASHSHSEDWGANPEGIARAFENGRFSVDFDERLTRQQPQSWFV